MSTTMIVMLSAATGVMWHILGIVILSERAGATAKDLPGRAWCCGTRDPSTRCHAAPAQDDA